jgi:hypothetical protein
LPSPTDFPAGVLSNADQKITVLLTPAQPARYAKLKERGWPALRRLQTVP